MKIDVKPLTIRVPGFRFGAAACGLKDSGKRDIGLIVSDVPATAVGAFTANRVQAAPVQIGKERIRGGKVQAVLVNSASASSCRATPSARACWRRAAISMPTASIARSRAS